jgi:hypothetical protein
MLRSGLCGTGSDREVQRTKQLLCAAFWCGYFASVSQDSLISPGGISETGDLLTASGPGDSTTDRGATTHSVNYAASAPGHSRSQTRNRALPGTTAGVSGESWTQEPHRYYGLSSLEVRATIHLLGLLLYGHTL